MRDVEVSIDTPLQAFNETLDGNGYTITNVGTIANAVTTAVNVYVGLFERINAGATVKNLVLDGIHINASTTLANNSYATGNIRGDASNTANYSGLPNENRLARVYAGSLVGFNDNWQGGTARVTNSFGAGSIHVSRITSGQGSARVRLFAGRLVGNDGGVITNGYRINSQTLAVATSTSNPTYVTHYNQGTSRTIAQLRSLTGTGLNTWDTTTIWRIHTDKYPTLRMEEI